MSILSRIKNLWDLSSYKPLDELRHAKDVKSGDTFLLTFSPDGTRAKVSYPPKRATIIDIDEKPTFDLKDEQL